MTAGIGDKTAEELMVELLDERRELVSELVGARFRLEASNIRRVISDKQEKIKYVQSWINDGNSENR